MTPGRNVWLPLRGHFVRMMPRQAMKAGHPGIMRARGILQAPPLPIDWTRHDSLPFPFDGNDQYGDCMYAAACHADNLFTGNVGTESTFDQKQIVAHYLALSGGDNGLSEEQILSEWEKRGLASVPEARIYPGASVDIDPTNPTQMAFAIWHFGGVLFMLAVPDKWINGFTTDAVWDAPATPDENNGHGVWLAAVDEHGRYKVETWGTHCWLTPEGVHACDPGAFAVVSPRWFDAAGYCPTGLHYTEVDQRWQDLGGSPLPPSTFPAPSPPTPTPSPIPTPMPPNPGPVPPTAVWLDPPTRSYHAPAGMKVQTHNGLNHQSYLYPDRHVLEVPESWTRIK